MMEKKQIRLDQKELEDCCEFQKSIMQSFAQFSYKYNDDKNFEIFAVALGLVISNIMSTFGVKNIKHFLNDLTEMVLQTHDKIKSNASYMEFRNGEKISEGNFN